jgi:hypothetical protein
MHTDLFLFPSAILGLQGFFPLKGETAAGVGSIEYPSSERKRLAALYAMVMFSTYIPKR